MPPVLSLPGPEALAALGWRSGVCSSWLPLSPFCARPRCSSGSCICRWRG